MKNQIRKVLCVLMALAMVTLGFAACGGTEAPAADDTTASAEDTVYTVGICQLVQHVALDAATEGFKAALTEKLGDKVKFDEQNASNEPTNCSTICGTFVSNKVDLIMANATPALTAAASATGDIPIVATSITDFATALSITDWNGKTGTNITGTADLAPLDQQAQMIKELCPDAKTVGVIYCSAEANSKYQYDVIKGYLEELGLTVNEYTFTDSNDVSNVAAQAAENSDVLFAPTDNTVASNAEAIYNAIESYNVPLVAGESGICKGTGIATLSIDYYDIGYKAGEMAYDILVNSADPAEMEIAYSDNPVKMYMADRCEALGITVDDTYEAIVLE